MLNYAMTGSLKWHGICELRSTLQQKICKDLHQKPEARVVPHFHKRLQAYVDTTGGHFEHFIRQTFLTSSDTRYKIQDHYLLKTVTNAQTTSRWNAAEHRTLNK